MPNLIIIQPVMSDNYFNTVKKMAPDSDCHHVLLGQQFFPDSALESHDIWINVLKMAALLK